MQILILAAIVLGLLAFGKLLYVLWHSGGGISVRLLEDEPPLSSWSLAKIVDDDEALHGYAPRSFAKPAAKSFSPGFTRDHSGTVVDMSSRRRT